MDLRAAYRRFDPVPRLDSGPQPGNPAHMPPSAFARCLLAVPLLAALLASSVARAEEQVLCPTLFVGGQPPALLNPRLAARTHGLCFDAYAVFASGVTRGPLWSAEHPTRKSLQAAHTQPRINLFQPESALPFEDRAELEDYARSGLDRGHMKYPAESILDA